MSCEIVRWTEDGFPGRVEARLIDADGTVWTFEDKAPVFSAEALSATTSYPVPGSIRCVIVDEDVAVGRTTIDTSSPDGIAANDRRTIRFSMASRAVAP